MYTCAHAIVHVHLWAVYSKDVCEVYCLPQSFSTFVFKTENWTEPGAHWFKYIDWWVSTRNLSVSVFTGLELQICTTVPSIAFMCKGLNSGPHAWTRIPYWVSYLFSLLMYSFIGLIFKNILFFILFFSYECLLVFYSNLFFPSYAPCLCFSASTINVPHSFHVTCVPLRFPSSFLLLLHFFLPFPWSSFCFCALHRHTYTHKHTNANTHEFKFIFNIWRRKHKASILIIWLQQ